MEHRDFDSGNRHRLRGVLVAVVLGPLMAFFAVNAALALVAQFVAGWTPGSWFSSNVIDWLFADGAEGGAANYFTFMVNAVLSSLCWRGIAWAFAERTD